MAKPIDYTPELGERILSELAYHDGGIRSFCDQRKDWCPNINVIYRWRDEIPDFAEGYAQAREKQLQMMAEDIVDTANDDTLDPQDKRIRIDTKKWLLAKLMHRTYGDKLDVTSGGEALSTPSHMIDARVQSIIMQARARKQGVELPALDDKALKLLE